MCVDVAGGDGVAVGAAVAPVAAVPARLFVCVVFAAALSVSVFVSSPAAPDGAAVAAVPVLLPSGDVEEIEPSAASKSAIVSCRAGVTDGRAAAVAALAVLFGRPRSAERRGALNANGDVVPPCGAVCCACIALVRKDPNGSVEAPAPVPVPAPAAAAPVPAVEARRNDCNSVGLAI